MTEPLEIDSAAEINARAAAWLRKRHFSEWTNEDEAALQVWLAETSANRVGYWRLSAAWNRMDRLAALQTMQPLRERAKKNMPPRLKIAAAFTGLAMLAAGTSLWLIQPRDHVYSTALGERKTIALSDGSRIELNTNTIIRLAADAKARTVRLERGEAYFEIRHDPNRLFVVKAGESRIVDVGTRFFVRNEPGHTEVGLVEGRARFEMPSSKSQIRSMSLAAGDMVVASTNRTVLTRQPLRDLTNDLGWRRGLLVFKHITLGEAAAEFNRYNPEKIVVADESAARLTLNGTFKIDDVAAFTDAAHAVFGLRVDIRGQEIVISR